jgi:hypothetical protein
VFSSLHPIRIHTTTTTTIRAYLNNRYEGAIKQTLETTESSTVHLRDNQRNDKSKWKQEAETSFRMILKRLSSGKGNYHVATLSGHSNFWLKTIQAYDEPDLSSCTMAGKVGRAVAAKATSGALIPPGCEAKRSVKCGEAFSKKIGNGGVLMVEWVERNSYDEAMESTWEIENCELVFGEFENH